MTKISVLLPVFNAEKTIGKTLESVQWADEIVVVDSFSTDRTLEICRAYHTVIIQHAYINSAKQKNWALDKCHHEWVFQIDSDEVLEAGGAEEILNAAATADDHVDAFQMARKNHVLGKWFRHGGIYPDWQKRLFRKSRCRWFEKEVHSDLENPGTTGRLKCHLIHDGMPTISRQLRNLDRYTRYEADQLKKENVSFHWYQMIVKPAAIFMYRYFYKKAFLEGWRGLILSAFLMFYTLLMYAKLWEMKEMDIEKSPE